MVRSGHCLAWGLLIVFVFSLTFHDTTRAQDADGPRCSKCKTTGKVENKYLTPALAALEAKVVHCSYIFEQDKKGHGNAWYPCERCRNPALAEAARRQFDAIVAKKTKWLERRRQKDSFLNTKLLYVETDHFVIAWDIPKIVTKEKKTYRMHEAMHLYAERLETFYNDFMNFFGIDEREIRNKTHYVYLFERQKHSFKAAKELTGLNCWNAAKMPGNPSILVSFYDKANMHEEELFHQHLIHHLSHLLNVSYYRMEWMASTAGWADEGLAHFFEVHYFKRASNSCDEEGEEEEVSNTDWEYEVRRDLAAGNLPSFAELINKSVTSLHGMDHQTVWSIVDFLLKKRDPGKFKLFMKAIKDKKECRDALKEAYGLNVITFQREWEEYVLANYREKPLKQTGVRPRRLRRR